MAAGAQDIHVQVIVPLSGPGKGQIGVDDLTRTVMDAAFVTLEYNLSTDEVL
jgi:hypothetical protein